MKLDEKLVTYFESCNSPVDKQGYLYKKGEIKTSYQKRWCVLKGNLLFYKESASDRDLTGVIVLEGCTVQLCESEEQFAFSLVWSEPGLRTYKFAADDQASQESWIKALLSANHGYLSLLLMDLEKKYRDALAAFPRETAKPFTMPNFGATGTDFSAAYRSRQLSTLPSNKAPAAAGAAAASALSNSATLHALSYPTRPTVKSSPKQLPRRNINAVPLNIPDMPMGEWSSFCVNAEDDFSKLHEDFGKEVKELIARWSRQKRDGRVVQEEDLIDFG